MYELDATVIARTLIENKADINVRNNIQRTPLLCAVMEGKY